MEGHPVWGVVPEQEEETEHRACPKNAPALGLGKALAGAEPEGGASGDAADG